MENKPRWVIAEVTVKVALAVQGDITNDELELHFNTDLELPLCVLMPAMRAQLEEDAAMDEPLVHCHARVLRDARKSDIKKFSIEDLAQKLERKAKGHLTT